MPPPNYPNHQVLFTASDGWVFFLMVGVFFFFQVTSSPILDLEHFSQVILRIVLQIIPTTQNNTNHQVLFYSYSGHHFSQVIYGTTDFATPNYPNHQVLFTASDGWVFFLISSPILDLEHFSQVILRIVLQIMPTPQKNPNHQVLFTASDGWVFFF